MSVNDLVNALFTAPSWQLFKGSYNFRRVRYISHRDNFCGKELLSRRINGKKEHKHCENVLWVAEGGRRRPDRATTAYWIVIF